MFNVRFDRVVSIGDSCGCAILLRESRLRMSSGPFDWIAGASFEQRIKTLCCRFADFLKLENIVWYGPGEQDRANDLYRDRTTDYRFVHDFPKRVVLQDSFPLVREKYDRRINRLLKWLDGGETICFVWRSFDEPTVTDDVCEAAVSRLRESFPKATCRLLIIENDPELPRGVVRLRRIADGGCVNVCGRFFSDGDVKLTGDLRPQLKMLKSLPRSSALVWRCRKGAALRAVVRFISLWHLNRAARKLSRERWTQRLSGAKT